MSDHSNNHKEVEAQYRSGANVSRQITPGGHPIDNSQPAFPVYHRKFGDPSSLGLLAFACTTYVLSLINIGARGVTSDAPIIGLAIAFGGTAQFLAGMWEFAAGNTFGATAFSGYGAFWWSFGLTVLLPNAIPALAVEAEMFENYLGFYLSAFFIFTVIMFIASLRSSVALASLFFFLSITFLLLFAAFFSGVAAVKTAGGSFGLITAAIVSIILKSRGAFYIGLANLLNNDAPFRLPVFSLAKSD